MPDNPAPITQADRDLVARLSALTKADGVSAAHQIVANHREAQAPRTAAELVAIVNTWLGRDGDWGAWEKALDALCNPEPMAHRCATCGTKDGHADGCAENVPPELGPIEQLVDDAVGKGFEAGLSGATQVDFGDLLDRAAAMQSATNQAGEAERLRAAMSDIASMKTELPATSDYARGWNDARFRVMQIAGPALATQPATSQDDGTYPFWPEGNRP